MRDKERWKRLNLLDILLMFPAYAVAFAVVRWWTGGGVEEPIEMADTPAPAAIGVMMVLGLTLGSAIAGPVALATHFLLYGRRAPLSVGEGLWLAQLGVSTIFFPATIVTAVAWWMLISLQLVLSFAAILLLTDSLLEHRWRGGLGWTDFFGMACCAATGIAAAMMMAVAALSTVRI